MFLKIYGVLRALLSSEVEMLFLIISHIGNVFAREGESELDKENFDSYILLSIAGQLVHECILPLSVVRQSLVSQARA